MDSQESIFFIAVLLIALLLGVLVSGFIYFLVRQGRSYRRLKEDLALAQTAIEERERERIGGALHDEVCTLLVAARQEVALVQAADEKSAVQLLQCERLIKETVERTRSLAHCLRPAMLEQLGLEQSLWVFIDSLPPAFGRKVQVQYRIETELDEDLKLTLYRIVQELLQNALKHSQCRRLLLQLKEERGRLFFHYLDDGAGFCYNPYQRPGGQGLYSVKSRVTMMGGSLTIKTQPREGTQYFFDVPLKKIL